MSQRNNFNSKYKNYPTKKNKENFQKFRYHIKGKISSAKGGFVQKNSDLKLLTQWQWCNFNKFVYLNQNINQVVPPCIWEFLKDQSEDLFSSQPISVTYFCTSKTPLLTCFYNADDTTCSLCQNHDINYAMQITKTILTQLSKRFSTDNHISCVCSKMDRSVSMLCKLDIMSALTGTRNYIIHIVYHISINAAVYGQ